ncbi:hypothetical protein ABFW14_32595 [Mycolicibacterium fortuitum]|uniref:Uncharacterized protein n=1 Tax=Mycolicibacterium septicum DSM 44393 TaxID=1341646 RepID=A0A7X6MU79_9MYCO|nr:MULTISPECIES: hypothetical protein [Mycolicibacterium]NKZ15015.1 hypothetical protein [Mycolicibacterium septicum DSM 44393]
MNNLSTFLVINDGDNTERLYWFGRHASVINLATIYPELEYHSAATHPQAQQRITAFLDDSQQTVSPVLGTDRYGRALHLLRAAHHRDQRRRPVGSSRRRLADVHR